MNQDFLNPAKKNTLQSGLKIGSAKQLSGYGFKANVDNAVIKLPQKAPTQLDLRQTPKQ